MKGITKAAKQANGRSQACATCPLNRSRGVCLPEIQRVCSDAFVEGFYHGAEWRINSVWHNSKTEVPDVNTIVLVEKEDGSIWQYKVFAKSQMLGWKRWAYIKDLIPNE